MKLKKHYGQKSCQSHSVCTLYIVKLIFHKCVFLKAKKRGKGLSLNNVIIFQGGDVKNWEKVNYPKVQKRGAVVPWGQNELKN